MGGIFQTDWFVHTNPDMDTVVKSQDCIYVLARDAAYVHDHFIVMNGKHPNKFPPTSAFHGNQNQVTNVDLRFDDGYIDPDSAMFDSLKGVHKQGHQEIK